MAVTTRDYNLTMATPGQIIDTIETSLADLGFHAPVTNGYVLTFTNTAGTTLAAKANERYLVKQSATSGTGTGAVFDILRSATGSISTITLVTGGSGYAATNTITINGSAIGGVDVTDNITITVSTIANGAGSTVTFFKKDTTTSPLTAAWGVAKVVNNSAKKLGTTFWIFYCASTAANQNPIGGVTPVLYVRAAPGFNPTANTIQGVANFDYSGTTAPNQSAAYSISITASSTSTSPILLRTRQSTVDSNFATFSFFEGNNNRNPFFISKYDNSVQPWDLDDVFLGSAYEIFAGYAYTVNDAGIVNRTRMTAMPKRQAEAGYSSYYLTDTTTIAYNTAYFRTSSGSRRLATPAAVYDSMCFYVRRDNDIQKGVQTQAVFKNVPINATFAPVPYYLPSDFVLAEIPFGWATQGDTLTVNAGEVYTAVQTAINTASGSTITLAARTT